MSLPPPRRALLVVNPRASRAVEHRDGVAGLLERRGIAVERLAPGCPGALAARVREAGDRVDCVVVGGGDGSLHRAVPALLESRLPLGILPLGTANDLARTLAIPADPEAAAEVIHRGALRAIDLGRVDGEPFLNVASLGIGSRVTRRLSRRDKRRFGALSYPLHALAAVRAARPFRVEIDCDGETERLRALQVFVGNGPHYGGGMTIDAGTRIDDGRLAVCAIEAQPLFGLLRLVPHLWRGSARESEGARVRRAERVRILTSRRLRVSADGEPCGRSPCRFDVMAGALRVFVPEDATPGAGPPATTTGTDAPPASDAPPPSDTEAR